MDKLLGMKYEEIQQVAKDLGMPGFAAKQITAWLYDKKISSIDEMSNLSLAFRERLKERYELGVSAPVNAARSQDGTVKYLFQVSDKEFVETVYIPDGDRHTLCVSSQAGCKMHCAFCHTGREGFHGQLSAADILNQIMSVPEAELLTNLVFMGMGEPMDNLPEVMRALDVLTADYGYAWSPRRITVSTIGLLPGLRTFLEQSACHLAVSMHSPFHQERLELMPVERAYPLAEVLSLVRRYDFSHQRRVSFEYILFEGYNDTPRHAIETVRLLRGLECRVNLIRFHAIPGVNLRPTDERRMVAFRDYLSDNGITCTIRRSRGEDIYAACGMLAGKTEIPKSPKKG